METPAIRKQIVDSLGFYVTGETILEKDIDYIADEHHKRLYGLLVRVLAAMKERDEAFDKATTELRRQVRDAQMYTLRAITAGVTGAMVAHDGNPDDISVEKAVRLAREIIKQTTPQEEEPSA